MDSEQIQFGKYTLIRRIGKGGMAEVFLARVEGPEGVRKPVVIKRILPQVSRDRQFVDMFIDEARISVLLRHGNIVPVFDFGKIEECYYLAMEYADGVTLAQVLQASREKRMPLPVELAVFVATEVCKGLDHAHRLRSPDGEPLRVVHRDISPQNVMITFDGEVKLLDFGIARAAGRISSTAVGVVKGKSEYMSPEQVRSLPVDARSDLFSLGVVLHEMLTGTRLFQGNDLSEVFERIAATVVVPPSRHREEVSGELDRIVLRALEREPRKRYAGAAEMGADLTRELYRLTPAFLPQALSAFTREVCDLREKQPRKSDGLEEALVGQIGSGRMARPGTSPLPSPDGREKATTPLKPGTSQRSPASSRPRPVLWVVAGAGLLAAIVSAVIVVSLGEKETDASPDGVVTGQPPTKSPPRDPPPAIAEPDPVAKPVEPGPVPGEPPPAEMEPENEEPRKPAPKRGKKRVKKTPTFGKVLVNAEPWADVYWNSKKLGHTPILDLELPVGHHVLRLVNPEFGAEKKVSVEVKPEGTAKVVVRMLE